ncbi:hypothetical protein H6B10_17570, partial [Gemmiger formicilis]|nr:hypothetical protein [Gemmiger formicilis]
DCDADELLARFCAVSGREDVVDAACTGYEVLHTETLGRTDAEDNIENDKKSLHIIKEEGVPGGQHTEQGQCR